MKKILIIFGILSMAIIYGQEKEQNTEANKLLTDAIKNFDVKKVQEALNNGADVNHKIPKIYIPPTLESDGYTPLMLISAEFGPQDNQRIARQKIAKLLIDAKANINEKNERGETALMLAASKDHIGIIILLIENKADLNSQDNLGNTALMMATRFKDSLGTNLLLKAGAKIMINKEGKSYFEKYLTFIDISDFIDAVRDNDLKKAESLLPKININGHDNKGRNALITAIIQQNLEMIDWLLKNNADPNVKLWGQDARWWAKNSQNQEIIKLFP